ncbi:19950_t:CDS:2, partial [Racocetra persica]
SSYFTKIISLFIICSITLVESFNCPLTPNPHEALQTFIIQLSPTASKDVINNHFAMLTSCFNKKISSDSAIQSSNPSIIRDVSFGSFNCYIGKFGPSDAAGLANLPEVVNVERDRAFRINSFPTYFSPPTTTATMIPPTMPINLDRIDQQHRPLDGNYTCPKSAGSKVNVYIVDTMSIGGPKSDAVNNATVEVGKKGVHFVVAAGNDFGGDTCEISPASAPNAIAVGATVTDTDNITDFSNIGKCVNIFAPGTDITAAGNRSPIDLLKESGASSASPHVAGTVALIIASSGNGPPDEMKQFLDKLSTKNVVGGDLKGSPNRFIRVPRP